MDTGPALVLCNTVTQPRVCDLSPLLLRPSLVIKTNSSLLSWAAKHPLFTLMSPIARDPSRPNRPSRQYTVCPMCPTRNLRATDTRTLVQELVEVERREEQGADGAEVSQVAGVARPTPPRLHTFFITKIIVESQMASCAMCIGSYQLSMYASIAPMPMVMRD